MNFTKFDKIQLVFNALLIAATILNLLVIFGVCQQWLSFIGFVLAIAGCVITNSATGGRGDSGQRQTVNGNPFLAGLTYVTGAAWLITFAMIQFFHINVNVS